MRRREFITLLGGAAAGWPLAVCAERDRVRRIAVLMLYVESDPEGQLRAAAFRQGLEKLGWTIDRDLQINFRWGVGDADWIRSAAAQLLESGPDLMLANGGPAARAAQQASRTLPIIFIGGADPVAEGFVQSLARPSGNMTGFATPESTVGAKLLALLKEVAPRVTRVAVLLNPDNPGSVRLAASAATAGETLAIDTVALPVRDSQEIALAMTKLASDGLIVPPDPTTNTHRKLIVELAGRHRLPAVYALRAAAFEGGLMSYGVSIPDLFRQAADYADRILRGGRPEDLPVVLPTLKGAKPADLPVLQSTKFEFVINLQTARALGLDMSPTLLARADEVIE
jgi:putative ABC transport system substrate-binding protein